MNDEAKRDAQAPLLPCLRERGVVLFIALIVLVVLSLAGVALVRSVDTNILLAGNMAFRQAAVQASDLGVEAAFSALGTLTAAPDTDVGNQYFATRQVTDTKGVPTTINWSNVPCRDDTGANVTCSTQAYQVKYVIDRLCEGPTPVTDIQGKCFSGAPATGSGTKKAGGVVFSQSTEVYYRATVQVTGPRNTISYVQVILSR